VSRGLYERLTDIKERCEQLVEDLHGDPDAVSNDRVLAKAVLYDLHVIGEACGALSDEIKSCYVAARRDSRYRRKARAPVVRVSGS
jgi:uncharacterized protein with HEPN domain